MPVRAALMLLLCCATLAQAAEPVTYPPEIRDCEPCKRLWLQKHAAASAPEAASAPRAAPSSGVVYPPEIRDCEPCKRLWLQKHPPRRASAAP